MYTITATYLYKCGSVDQVVRTTRSVYYLDCIVVGLTTNGWLVTVEYQSDE